MKLSRWWAALVALALLYVVRGILPPFVLAIGLAYILAPGVDALATRLRTRRIFIVLGLYLIILASLTSLVMFLERPLSRQSESLARNRTELIQSSLEQVIGPQGIRVLGVELQPQPLAEAASARIAESLREPGDALRLAERALSIVLRGFLTLVVLFYLLLDWERLGELVRRFIPVEQQARFEVIAGDIHRTLGRYVRGQLFLIGLMSLATWLFLRFAFHLHYSLLISIATGFLEIIPLLGPILAAGIAVVVAVGQGGLHLALLVVVFYTVLRQVEDQLVMPNVVGKAVHLHPVITLFAVLAGESLWGILGALLAVPVAAAIKVVFDHVQPVHPAPAPVPALLTPQPALNSEGPLVPRPASKVE